MKIYSMTATFGKLTNETLTLQPGLNVIHAPNEWGKSTWCAFLLNMLYGIDTRERTKQGALADKDRYAPWSGASMAGRIDLHWQGRDITIERSSNARTPLGIFRAYETETGIDIPELTASNCGQQLLGVERNVFLRAGFLRLADLPVTQDDTLRRRLNNLVTTGDESGDADRLGQSLKDLKNKCRSNKANGLLPEAEAQRDSLREQLRDLQDLTLQTQQTQARQAELEQQLHALENHRTALEYQASLENAQKVTQAQDAAEVANLKAKQLAEATRNLPTQAQAREELAQLQQLQDAVNALHADERLLPGEPVCPAVPAHYQGLNPEEAVQLAEKDAQIYDALTAQMKSARTRTGVLCGIMALLCAGLAITAFALPMMLLLAVAAIPAAVAVILLIAGSTQSKNNRTRQQSLQARHPGLLPEQWAADAQAYAQAQQAYVTEQNSYRKLTESHRQKKEALDRKLQDLTGGASLSQCRDTLTRAIAGWDAAEQARREAESAHQHAQALAAMAVPATPPQEPDNLQYSPKMTEDLLANARFEQRQLQLKLGQCMGQMEALGSPTAIQARLDATTQRITRLENYSAAIEMAQDALFKATVALQRRFSPRITKRAQELFSKLTGNRYQRITMAEDMSLHTAAVDEVTLQELRRRSDGTVDQLYFALRLAVADELTPDAPLILDDALVRFDETRLASAMEILKEEARDKQVILFTCQHREDAFL